MKFSWKNIENWRSWKMSFFCAGHFETFFSKKKNFFCFNLNENKQPVHMRCHLFLHNGWFLQNLGTDFIRTNMHTTVPVPFLILLRERGLVFPFGFLCLLCSFCPKNCPKNCSLNQPIVLIFVQDSSYHCTCWIFGSLKREELAFPLRLPLSSLLFLWMRLHVDDDLARKEFSCSYICDKTYLLPPRLPFLLTYLVV